MAEDIVKQVGIEVVTTATGDGAERAAAGLEKNVAAAEKLTAANQRLAATSQGGGAAAEKLTAEQVRQNALLEQKRMLEEAITRQAMASAEGKTQEAAALAEQIEMRRIAIQLQQQLLIGEEEALAVATQRVLAEAEVLEAKEAQNAASERGFLGARGLHHMLGELGESAGLGPLLFQAFGLFELVKMIYEAWESHGEAIKKAREEQEKMNREVEKEATAIDRINSLAELESHRAEVIERINELNAERANAEGEEYDRLTGQVNAQEQILNKIEEMTPAVMERQDTERQTRENLEAQKRALDDINTAYETARKSADELLRTHEKIEEIQVGAQIAAVNRNERDGKLTHEKAEAMREQIKAAEELDKFNREQASSAGKIKSYEDENADLTKQADQKALALKEAEKKAELAADAVARYGPDAQARANDNVGRAQGIADSKEKDLADFKKFLRVDENGNPPAGIDPALVDELKQRQAEADAAKQALSAAQETVSRLRSESVAVVKDNEKAQKDLDSAREMAQSAKENAEKNIPENNKSISDEQAAMQGRADERAAQVPAQKAEDADKLEQAKKQDQTDEQKKNDLLRQRADLLQRIHELEIEPLGRGANAAQNRSREIENAKRELDRMNQAHPELGGTPAGAGNYPQESAHSQAVIDAIGRSGMKAEQQATSLARDVLAQGAGKQADESFSRMVKILEDVLQHTSSLNAGNAALKQRIGAMEQMVANMRPTGS